MKRRVLGKMLRTIMKSKIHNATVTQANLDYEGSITIDKELMEKADIVERERVQIVNLSNGERLETYVIVGEAGSGVIGMNGPAALKCGKGHNIHIISYVMVEDSELDKVKERVVILKEGNKVKSIIPEKDEHAKYGH